MTRGQGRYRDPDGNPAGAAIGVNLKKGKRVF